MKKCDAKITFESKERPINASSQTFGLGLPVPEEMVESCRATIYQGSYSRDSSS